MKIKMKRYTEYRREEGIRGPLTSLSYFLFFFLFFSFDGRTHVFCFTCQIVGCTLYVETAQNPLWVNMYLGMPCSGLSRC